MRSTVFGAALLLLSACGGERAVEEDRGLDSARNAADPAEGKAPEAPARAPSNDAVEAKANVPAAAPPVGACMMQDGKKLDVAPLKALGTEPFWAARVEGRCVTYLTPDNQKGTRIWTKYTPAKDGGTWSGALDGRRFELRAKAAPSCSDGMSDKVYPIEAELTALGEERRGCAEPG